MLVLIAALIVDTMINTTADSLSHQLATEFGVALFIILAGIFWLGSYVVLQYVKSKTEEIKSSALQFKLMHKIVTIVQCYLGGLLLVVIVQIVMTSHYYTLELPATSATSMLLNVTLMVFAAVRLFTWYSSNRNSTTILLLGLAFATFALTTATATVMDIYNFMTKPSVVSAQSEVVFPTFEQNTPMYLPHEIYHYADLATFVLAWVGIALLLRSYSQKLGKTKFWLIISLPLIYYLSTLIDFFKLYTPSTDLQYFYYYLYLSLNSTAGGILFGVALRSVAKVIRDRSVVRDYLIIAAYGIVLLFISDQATLTDSGYPPFGFVTISFMGLSAYLILVGFYSSAVSIGQNAKLRQSIRQAAIDQSKFLESIGRSQMEQQIEKEVMRIARNYSDKMAEDSGVQPSLSESEMKQYLEQVLEEVKELKKRTREN